eukprot:COSAG03_NODE_25489_length_265_cov_0.626506_1_plen_36_part_01
MLPSWVSDEAEPPAPEHYLEPEGMTPHSKRSKAPSD